MRSQNYVVVLLLVTFKCCVIVTYFFMFRLDVYGDVLSRKLTDVFAISFQQSGGKLISFLTAEEKPR
jgi:hypothetical protein